MKKPPAARPELTVGLLAATAMLMSLCACTSHQAAQAIAIAPVLTIAALNGGFDDSGEFVAYLSDGSRLEGQWWLVTRQSSAAEVTIQTPHGQVRPADLVKPDLPAFFSRVEGPPVEMLCAFSGDRSSGYRCRCADRYGIEWIGSLGRYQYVVNPVTDRLVVALREAADCQSCDRENDLDSAPNRR